jgi:hypothetical protein
MESHDMITQTAYRYTTNKSPFGSPAAGAFAVFLAACLPSVVFAGTWDAGALPEVETGLGTITEGDRVSKTDSQRLSAASRRRT